MLLSSCTHPRTTLVPPTPIASIVNAPESLPGHTSTGFPALDAAQAEAASLLLALHERLAIEPDDAGPGLLRRLLGRGPRTVDPVPGIYLWGGVGRGKTYLMDWFVDELPLPGKRRTHFHHFMRAVHDAMARLPKTPDPLEVVADQWRQEVRVLCLDEFVVTDIADAMILHRLLRALFSRGMTLVTTSNTQPKALYRSGLQRALFLPAIDLLERHTRVLELDGGFDYRLRALTEAGVWLDAGQGDEPMAACFERLTGGHAERVQEFNANGRAFPVRGLGTDVVWFDFAALCDTPRSAADYIEIAREYHTVLLSGLPQISPANEAAARRLVHLIDELYDQRVKLVVSAEVPLDRLYAGGLHDFPHERLLSRLTDMQSTGYLADHIDTSADPAEPVSGRTAARVRGRRP
jgi:cell division protein ZapE